ncbi:hypothetical protein F4780DRAFT_349971 [Xylariomycetidae sp. FL0641]|nr:hypothetical protein F4780DRAFT_349971 [Xylariomycetidae sp. FL0641]
MLAEPSTSVLGRDPTHRQCSINGYAFQQDAIQSFNGWQYACFYSSLPDKGPEPLYVHLSRRKLPGGDWETIVFEDYPQTVDDGHNTVQLGICPGDGTIHLSYDHHCDVLRYRHSIPNLATTPSDFSWARTLFTSTLSRLPGLATPETDSLLSYITYPRFVRLSSNLLFSFRTGKAGLGDDHLCVYSASTPSSSSAPSSSSSSYAYAFLGTPLHGVGANPYLNGLDARGGALYASWVWRGFVAYPGWDDAADTQHKAQAGPNSGANNHDLCFAWSGDGGRTWRNGGGAVVAELGRGGSVRPGSPGITAFKIPKGSGLANQEAQAVDRAGGVHVLNRDALDGGVQRWKHYYRAPDGTWTQRALPHVRGVYGGKRGQVCVSRGDDVYFVLPDAEAPELTILKASPGTRYAEYEVVWKGSGFPPSEPLVDKARLDEEDDDVLSVFTKAGAGDHVDVVVLDFDLGGA